MKEKNTGMLLLIILSIFFCATSVYGIAYRKGSIQNEIELGDIRIGIREYEIKDGKEVPYCGSGEVVPGDEVSKIPRITNYAQRCWIRVRLLFKNTRPDLKGLSCEMLQGIDDSWIRRGEYLYYTLPLEQEEHVDLFQGIRYPKEWGSEHAGQKLSLEIIAEAIQEANFQPAFSTDSPWYEEEIQSCVHEEDGNTTIQRDNMELLVEINEQAMRLLTLPGDFFRNFHNAMPGDELYDSAKVYNNSNAPVRLYFQTDIPDLKEEEQALLDEISLQINYNSQTVYAGNLRADSLEKGILLAQLPAGGKGTLDFKVCVPNSFDNSYALRKTAVKWIFSAFRQEKETVETTVTTAAHEKKTDPHTSRAKNAKTEDSSAVALWIKILVASAILAYLIWILKRKGVDKS